VNRVKRAVLIVCAGLGLGVSCAAQADLTADQTPFNSYRGIWVDRFDYSVTNASSSIRTIMTNAAALGVTDVMFQVRGQADAYYWNNNGLEVRANGVTATNDPLAIAISEAHQRGIRVHAWINAMPLWNGTATTGGGYTPAAPASHLINTHPEYWIRDKSGNPLPFPTGSSGYVIVNPARDDVQAHINNVAKAITANYAVDGLHLDYIRLYSSNPGSTNVLEYPGDAFTVSLFQQQYPGQTPESNPANFKAFMAGRITDLVRSIRETTKANRPGAQLTASVWRDADIGLDEYQQDWARWIDQGLLDAAMPMIYRRGFGDGSIAGTTPDSGDLYRNNVTEGLNRRGTAGVMIGVGSYMQDATGATYAQGYANVWNQLSYAKAQGANGIQLFDLATLYNGSLGSNGAKQAVMDFFAANSGTPAVTGLGDFEGGGEGTFKWAITLSGSNRNVAASSTADAVSGEAHSGTGSQRIVINKTAGADSFIARHLSGTTTAGDFASNTPFASIGSVGVWLKTTTADLQVSIALDDPTTGDRGYLKNVIADGQWHRYEWFLADPTHWDAWVGGSDGHLGTITAIDSIQFIGTVDSSTIFMDDVFHNPGAAAANQWTFDADGNWNNSGHWTGGVPNGVGKAANLFRRGTAARSITLDTPVTLGSLTIDNSSSYTIKGGGANQLTLDDTSGTAKVSVINRGAHVISAPVVLQDDTAVFVDRGSSLVMSGTLNNSLGKAVIKTGDGVLELSGGQTHGTGAVIDAWGGVTRVNANLGANASVDVKNGAVEFNVGQTIDGLLVGEQGRAQLANGRRVVLVKSLSIDGGQLDLADGGFVQDYTDGAASPLLATRDLIRDGAIVSSAAVGGMGIGYGESAGGTFLGQTVDSSAVVARLTLRGDTGLDGVVDFNDLVALAQHYNTADGSAVWAEGDFTYDGNVDFADLVALAQNYNGAMPAGAFLADFATDVEAAFAMVPEPSVFVMALAVLGISATLRKRSR
jgi:uncharacterized lipoprotein YddW (UPF0748 family)